ncbi:NifB/NifX family molybdenum-iron cluster-binding protein [endosymbiont of Ridgeia piscesae]|jgi:predicted Fe-Mo cluster-binding NifX family protein|uniref:Putative Fe-Mo cluster-binding protein, NifX family n=1 Tax=endosymbiont of Ridgeia piscesae TaxID=54398 RepID=A0A0T5ZAI4_9GAMM|nr:NifB/NifX family molybdenum-iron cluster-binding protein [endosymbiont of Ridgeia piscesae]KRT53551.1 putative Fe-Mo cluster-binding protein, NifX family [endosymbiont of Ridgeia piscesae]KRT59865.1 putative Fe-Mo cluster-binding protein, NifX family [endosymbiont of Ridgeia piscesae]
MKIAVTSQNFRTITGHAGKTRRFLIFGQDENGEVQELQRLDLPKAMSMHEFRGDEHPIFAVDVLITGGCGEGFIRRLGSYGVRVFPTSESDPQTAVRCVLTGTPLPAPQPHDHGHDHQHPEVRLKRE